MVKVNELRIGNIVEATDFNIKASPVKEICQYHNEYTKGMSVRLGDNYIDVTAINPISLTGDILIKNGFTKNVLGIYEYGEFSWSIGVFSIEAGNWLCKCEYVHQLQNIYFSLTGNEIEIKL